MKSNLWTELFCMFKHLCACSIEKKKKTFLGKLPLCAIRHLEKSLVNHILPGCKSILISTDYRRLQIEKPQVTEKNHEKWEHVGRAES